MTRFSSPRRRRMAVAVTAALLSLGVLTACGGGSSDGDSSGKSSTQRSSSDAGEKNGAKGGPESKPRTKGELQSGDALTSHNFALDIDGQRVEYLQEVSGLAQDAEQQNQQQADGRTYQRKIPGAESQGTVTVVRGLTQSTQFTELINGTVQPGSVTLAMLDYQDNAVKQYRLDNPTVIKVDNPADGSVGGQSVTIQFTSLTVS